MSSRLVTDLEAFLAEISEASGSSRFYDDILLSVEGIGRLIGAAEPSDQGARVFLICCGRFVLTHPCAQPFIVYKSIVSRFVCFHEPSCSCGCVQPK